MIQLNHKIKNSETQANVSFTRGGFIITDIWGSGLRVITDPRLAKTILAVKDKSGKKGVQSAAIWNDVAEADQEKVSVMYVYNDIKGKTFKIDDEAEIGDTGPSSNAGQAEPEAPKKVDGTKLVNSWKKFFSEFGHFNPQARFINSIARCKTVPELKEYVVGYFSLTNNSYLNELKEKVKCSEFRDLAEETIGITEKVINNRLEVYYGEPGGGKTTTAIKDNPGAQVVICHASMSPDELFRGFDFEDGKPTFKPCPVKEAMKAGQVVILDEINLLNEDCRRALQAICDGKDRVMINNEEIEIKPGFKIIGTMNLVVDEMVFGLPAPLVDRCEKIREFSMTPSMVASLAI